MAREGSRAKGYCFYLMIGFYECVSNERGKRQKGGKCSGLEERWMEKAAEGR